MALVLHGHPFSSYTQKILIALYENAIPFAWRVLDGPPAFDERAGELDRHLPALRAQATDHPPLSGNCQARQVVPERRSTKPKLSRRAPA